MQVKTVVMLGYQQPFVTKDVDISLSGKDEILVKIVATGVCYTDAVMRDNPGVVPMPVILGHEGTGIVASIGEVVSDIRVGDHVVFSYTACHYCENCLSNHSSACEEFNTFSFGGRHEDGITSYRLGDQDLPLLFGQSSFSQYMVTHASNVAVVDPEVDLTLLGPLGCGIQTGSGMVFNRLEPVIGESIVVFGCGAAGLSAIVATKLTGCSQIIAVDIYASCLVLVDEPGATHQIGGREQDVVALIEQITGKGAHYAVETTGVSATVLQAVHVVKLLGTVVIVGFTGDITFSVQSDLTAEGRSLTGVIEGNVVPALFIPLLAQQYKQGKFPTGKLIVRYPLADISQTFADSASGKVIKPVVVM